MKSPVLATNFGDEFCHPAVTLNRYAKVVSSRSFRVLKPFMRMPFGPYAQRVMADVPAPYLLSLKDDPRTDSLWPQVADYVRRHETELMEVATAPALAGAR